MIRINLLGQARPKTTGPAVPVEAWVRTFLLLGAVGLAVVILSIRYVQMKRDLDDTQRQITKALQEKARLEQVRQQVEQFGRDMSILQQRIAVIEELRRNRTGGSELLSTVANTVVRTDELWLTSLSRKGTSLELQGEAGSINAVANLITQMKRSGYFDKIEITETKENDLAKGVETYSFNLKADFKLPPGQQAQAGQPAPAAPGKS